MAVSQYYGGRNDQNRFFFAVYCGIATVRSNTIDKFSIGPESRSQGEQSIACNQFEFGLTQAIR